MNIYVPGQTQVLILPRTSKIDTGELPAADYADSGDGSNALEIWFDLACNSVHGASRGRICASIAHQDIAQILMYGNCILSDIFAAGIAADASASPVFKSTQFQALGQTTDKFSPTTRSKLGWFYAFSCSRESYISSMIYVQKGILPNNNVKTASMFFPWFEPWEASTESRYMLTNPTKWKLNSPWNVNGTTSARTRYQVWYYSEQCKKQGEGHKNTSSDDDYRLANDSECPPVPV
ncbi:hypothetical protein DFH08DRAFT_816819 [Mycena albidolilacea]|uniref:Uncharacterized protein n=1 Tax=Mycena albidolilacea TaxID=1033008 RepID=A0AAD6ZJ82_9AGAR|nr:hypothetical protein DFH08DRAFT_816819 [Mycena albidolilacea]